jgi:hypothetical protein
MPLPQEGEKISLEEKYGLEKGERGSSESKNNGTITGVGETKPLIPPARADQWSGDEPDASVGAVPEASFWAGGTVLRISLPLPAVERFRCSVWRGSLAPLTEDASAISAITGGLWASDRC